jgi:penicillin-binding protein 1A
VSKFFPKLKFPSDKLHDLTSTASESTSGTDVDKEKQDKWTSQLQQLKQGVKQATSFLKRQRSSDEKVAPVSNQQSNRKKWLVARYLVLLAGLGIGGGAIALTVGAYWLDSKLPDSTGDVLTYARPETLTIKAVDGSILKQSGPVTEEKLKIWQIPQTLIDAFIAIEDRRFYQHEGVDYQGILRAAVSNLYAGDVVEGGSTLTQQLARIVFLDQQRSMLRKLKEFRMAQKIEQNLTKEQILERYLNLVYLGEGAYGVADAAWVYFSKPLKDLTLSEMATLAGLPPAPNEYSPFASQELALQRRNRVLQRMQEANYISAAEAKAAMSEQLILKRSPLRRMERKASYFTEYIEKELPNYVSPKLIKAGGITVETTLNSEWQEQAENAIKKTIEENGRYSNFEQAALVAIDPRNGNIRAMVGGKDFNDNQFNRVTQAKRQPGSTFKAFVYTTAIAAGFTPYRGYVDAPITVDGYTPKNYSESYNGWMSMRDALINSINVVALKVLLDVGWQPMIDIAHKMGIESELQPIYSLPLGGSEVNLLELTSAYGTFATNGLHTKPSGIRRILNHRGEIIYQQKFTPERAIDEETSAIMNWMLRGVVNEGTGQAAQLVDRQVAGKTGTTDEARDLWFVGYIPQLVTGVWLGNDDNQPTNGKSTTAAYTWNQFMSQVVKEVRPEKFVPRPDNLENRTANIKVQPIQPKTVLHGSRALEYSSNEENSASTPSRRRRYRLYRY